MSFNEKTKIILPVIWHVVVKPNRNEHCTCRDKHAYMSRNCVSKFVMSGVSKSNPLLKVRIKLMILCD